MSSRVTLAQAKAHLSEMVERALSGEPVEITRRGTPVVRIVAIERPRPPLDVDAMRRLTDGMSGPEIDGEAWFRAFREDTRY